MKCIFYFIAFIVLLPLTGKSQSENTAITLDFFNSTDKINETDILGNFVYDNISLKEQKYIFKILGSEIAYIKVKGKIIELSNQHMVGTTDEVFKGHGYTVNLSVKTTNGYEIGTLEIINGNSKAKFKVHAIERKYDD